jgi:hypothetical protein
MWHEELHYQIHHGDSYQVGSFRRYSPCTQCTKPFTYISIGHGELSRRGPNFRSVS